MIQLFRVDVWVGHLNVFGYKLNESFKQLRAETDKLNQMLINKTQNKP